MLDRGDWALALAYAAAGIVAGFLAVALATGMTRRARLTG